MKDVVRYRAMESLCRQSAVFHPLESWQLLAEAEMWHHKALDEMASDALARDGTSSACALARTEALSDAPNRSRLPAG
jgi:hypothetical protein